MAEATLSTAEAARDRQEAPQEPTEAPANPAAPPTPPSPFGDLAERIAGAFTGWQGAAGKVRENLSSRSAALDPAIAEVEKAATAPRPLPPAPPLIGPPPSRQLTEFLAPVQGESPTTSITKLISAIGIFATGIGGNAKGDARAGLAALTGAMRGWQEGDVIRADRAFSDWSAKTQAAIGAWQRERQTYQDIMEAANLDLAQKFKLVELKALQEDNKGLADAAAKQDFEVLLRFLAQQQTHADAVQYQHDRLEEMKFEKQREHDRKVAHDKEMQEWRRSEAERHEREAKERAEDRRAIAAERLAFAREKWEGSFQARMGPSEIDYLAEVFNKTGKLPPMGAGMAGTRAAVFKRSAELISEQGETASGLIAKQQLFKAAQAALNTNMRMSAQIGSFIKTSERAIEMARELSEKTDRSGVPIFNRWLQAGQRAVAGNDEITRFDVATTTVAAEYARVMSSATGGGVSTEGARQHAFSLLNTAQTKEQYKAVLHQMHREMQFRVQSFREETKELQGIVQGTGTPLPAAPGAVFGGKGWKIERLPD